MRPLLGAAAGLAGVQLGAIVVALAVSGHGLLAPWWLYAAFAVLGVALTTAPRWFPRGAGRHHA